ncbi:MAG: hypothetical protein KDK30_15105, partial [Leptospiraceae bacterium]|nr:hypothetical protein [Leptospiraceae bacterium]
MSTEHRAIAVDCTGSDACIVLRFPFPGSDYYTVYDDVSRTGLQNDRFFYWSTVIRACAD